MVTCRSANQLKTPTKISWAFKMVSQFGSLGYTIMGKTADHTVVQKTIIDTLHKEGNPQTFIAKEAGWVLYPSILTESWVEGKSENRRLMRIVKQNRFKNLGELHKEWTEAGVKTSRATTYRRVNEFVYSCCQRRLTWAKEKNNWIVAQWSIVLFSDESKFCISFGNQGPRVWWKGGEAHSPSCLKSSVKFPQSVMIWGAMSSAGVGPLCFLKTNITAPIYQDILEHYNLKFVKWPWCWCAWLASKLTRPEPHRESMYCQEENEKQETKKCRWAEGHRQRNLDFYTTSAVSQTDHILATPNWGSN